MSNAEELIAERDRYKELTFQIRNKINEVNELNTKMEAEIATIQSSTRDRLVLLKNNQQKIQSVFPDSSKSDEIYMMEEELKVLNKQSNVYVQMYKKKKDCFEEGVKCLQEAFSSTLNHFQDIQCEIDQFSTRARSAPIISLDTDEHMEEINEVEIIEDAPTDKGSTEQTEQVPPTRTSTSVNDRKPPHDLLMFATKRLSEKNTLNLAEGAAFIRSKQVYDGVGVIPLDCPWFICYFSGRPHINFSCKSQDTLALLSMTTITDDLAPPGKKGGLMVIYRSKLTDIKKIIPFSLIGKKENQLKTNLNQLSSVLPVILQCLGVPEKMPFKLIKGDKLEENLRSYETSQGGIDYKFGLLYCGPKQTSEAEMYDNTDKDTTPEYKEFIQLIGNIIPLKGHKGYKAGLDVDTDTTGVTSLFTQFYSSQVMFHVASMLPHVEADPQKTEKKRQIGNDFCVLIYKEGDEVVDLSSFKSHFNNIFMVIKKIPTGMVGDGSAQYFVETWRATDVPEFEPFMPAEGSYISKEYIREYILSSLINGQISSYQNAEMRPKMVQTRGVCLKNIMTK
ncbi:rap GTPase-activating protein, putative [Entamoeba invadens IP1]|uniref:Rap GTPase-activating protein, putative n=1 Tax=Entamoeba invadens IP1 TaxID=370355 RepID=A0A0A1U003_ENTIV|nr:rap GTPase-activating protein, putative [Entamoeba invadens IP1]ELP85796.1 rap GTPase-activating protein, putative [Entamoeba invadens IP1]|eukprot:XP_004185142.1 rap GTPase-activating protein, putative [Entamoeba invadens IP1]